MVSLIASLEALAEEVVELPELAAAAADLGEQSEELAKANENATTLEALVASMESLLVAEAKFTPTEQLLVNNYSRDLFKSLSIKDAPGLSLESDTLGLESINVFVEKIIEALKLAYRKLVEAIKSFGNLLLRYAGRVFAEIKALVWKIEKIDNFPVGAKCVVKWEHIAALEHTEKNLDTIANLEWLFKDLNELDWAVIDVANRNSLGYKLADQIYSYGEKCDFEFDVAEPNVQFYEHLPRNPRFEFEMERGVVRFRSEKTVPRTGNCEFALPSKEVVLKIGNSILTSNHEQLVWAKELAKLDRELSKYYKIFDKLGKQPNISDEDKAKAFAVERYFSTTHTAISDYCIYSSELCKAGIAWLKEVETVGGVKVPQAWLKQ